MHEAQWSIPHNKKNDKPSKIHIRYPFRSPLLATPWLYFFEHRQKSTSETDTNYMRSSRRNRASANHIGAEGDIAHHGWGYYYFLLKCVSVCDEVVAAAGSLLAATNGLLNRGPLLIPSIDEYQTVSSFCLLFIPVNTSFLGVESV